MKIDNVDQNLNTNGPEKKKISFRRKEVRAQTDAVELSDKAKSLHSQNADSNYSTYAKKIEDAKTNLNSGLYEKQEYKEKTADKLLESKEFKDIAYNPDSLKSTASDKSSTEKIQKIKDKLAKGFYNKAEVLEKIADKLLKEFELE